MKAESTEELIESSKQPTAEGPVFSFFKGGDDVVAPPSGMPFDWNQAASKVREQLADALNAKNVAFLFGSGCSSYLKDKVQLGIPTMKPMAANFVHSIGDVTSKTFVTSEERASLGTLLGINISDDEYAANIERLMEVLYSFQLVLKRSSNKTLKSALEIVKNVIEKTTKYVLDSCTIGNFSKGDETVCGIYQSFYRKLIYRDRALPRPWVFTTNYDLFNETAMDRSSIPYCNGFSGTVERRFNPATFRYSLAEQLDLTDRKWTAVDNFVYLCKLHGSINWIEESTGLFPIREVQLPVNSPGRVMIYPAPAKQNASFGSPYSDLFREFQSRIVRDQSVLFVLGYGFTDEHVNNIIFQALTIPTFRMIAFVPPDGGNVIKQLRELGDPRIWIIGGAGPTEVRKAHHFDTFVEKFMPEPPSNKVDTAIEKIFQTLVSKTVKSEDQDANHGE